MVTSRSQKINRSIATKKRKRSRRRLGVLMVLGILVLVIALWQGKRVSFEPISANFPALAMSGGDPYIRALMRTISASESNVFNPYIALYGGEHFHDFSRHPNQCIAIVTGPNLGKCTTAAGRYQFLTSTWVEKARKYHPKRSLARPYPFAPEDQDQVVYAWLKDHHAWGNDISTLLKKGNIEQVLKLLSNTWTSLGYGGEDNLMTPYLSRIYQKLLAKEFAQERNSLNQE